MARITLHLILVCICFVSSAVAATYSGVMDKRVGFTTVPGFTAQSPSWYGGTTAGKGLRLEWTADDTTNPGYWTYTYGLIRGVGVNKCDAFFDIETADDFIPANIVSWRVLSATDRSGAVIPSGLASITLSPPTNFNAVHDFTGDRATPAYSLLGKFDLSHYSGDPGIAAPGVPGGNASATPSVGPVPHPFFGLRWTFPGTGFDLYEPCAWSVELVSDRAPMWGDFFLWGDQVTQSPMWYANAYNDQIDNPVRETAPPANNLAAEYPGWLLVPGPLRLLTLNLAGGGSGGVVSVPAAINCNVATGPTCTAQLNNGVTVQLTATPDPQSSFSGWSGDCNGTGVCSLTMTAPHNVTATFALITNPLTVSLAGAGRVTGTTSGTPATVSFTTNGSVSVASGATVTLYPLPANGAIFMGWSGACSGLGDTANSNACTVTMNAAKDVTATFDSLPSVALTAPTSGAVYTNPATISLSATASDPDGTISKVEFYNGTTLLGSATTVPYAYTWTPVPGGSYSITARAYDNLGLSSATTATNVAVTSAVTYNGNGSTAGTVPVDTQTYLPGATVSVLTAGTLIRSGFTFNGWNTAANGTGTAYTAGATFGMANANVILYAQWLAVPVAAPTVTSFSPASGVIGTTVTINGTNFTGATGVTFNTTPASTFTVVSVTKITAVVPTGATTGAIKVTTPGGTGVAASNFTVPAPTVTSFTPTSGIVGATVTLTGTNFSGATVVKFNTTQAVSFAVVSATSITVTIPPGATTGKISVTGPSGTGTSAASFTVIGAPALTSFTPVSGAGGVTVTISGTNLGSATLVTFNGIPATITTNTATAISTKVPTGATTGFISVTTAAGTGTSTTSFTVPAPTVTSFTPTSGIVGATVTLTGTNFLGASGVMFNTTPATSFSVVSATSLTAVVPVGATTGKISVTGPSGVGTSAAVFTVIGAPVLTSFTPTSGLVGTTVTITGTSLGNATAVTFNGIPAIIVTNTATTISMKVPDGATTGPLKVTTALGTGISGTIFTVPAPTLTSFSPATGGIGTGVTITGTNFTGTTSVKFNGVAAPYIVTTATTIATTVPSGATTGPISVATYGGVVTSTGSFTVGATTAVPKVTSFTPTTGGVGATVSVSGSNFVGATAVKFNGITVTTFTVLSNTSLVTAVPPGATTGTISVATPNGTGTSATVFTVGATPVVPAITSFTPTSGKVGTVITVTGTNLGGVIAANVGGVGAALQVRSATSLLLTVPTGAVTGTLSITTNGGSAVSTGLYTVTP